MGRRFGILTSGGDCPGLNAVIRGAVLKGETVYGHTYVGFRDGWRGLVYGDILELDRTTVRGLSNQGGTILGTSRFGPYSEPDGGPENIKKVIADLELEARLARNPELHVYHFAPYGPAALRRLVGTTCATFSPARRSSAGSPAARMPSSSPNTPRASTRSAPGSPV